MKTLSVTPAWAWLIIYAGKDIENRTWPTGYRGPLAIHASKTMTYRSWQELDWFLRVQLRALKLPPLPSFHDLKKGGVIGVVDVVDCVQASTSPWFFGPYGFRLGNPRPIPFHPCPGRLGFFEVLVEL